MSSMTPQAKPLGRNFTTQMHEHLDNTTHPPRPHPSRGAAIEYAKIRTSERNCDITVRDPNGLLIGKFADGREVTE